MRGANSMTTNSWSIGGHQLHGCRWRLCIGTAVRQLMSQWSQRRYILETQPSFFSEVNTQIRQLMTHDRKVEQFVSNPSPIKRILFKVSSLFRKFRPGLFHQPPIPQVETPLREENKYEACQKHLARGLYRARTTSSRFKKRCKNSRKQRIRHQIEKKEKIQ